MTHRCEIWYLELSSKIHHEANINCLSNAILTRMRITSWFDSIIVNLKILKYFLRHQWVDIYAIWLYEIHKICQRDAQSWRRSRNRYEKHESMQKMQIRAFLIWLNPVRESGRLVCEKIRYFQFLIEFLFFLIEFLLCKIKYVMTA